LGAAAKAEPVVAKSAARLAAVPSATLFKRENVILKLPLLLV
jgi:hypothetical protein